MLVGRKLISLGLSETFLYKSFHHAVEPHVIYSLDAENDLQHRFTYVLVKVDGESIGSMILYIEGQWKSLLTIILSSIHS